ncbi:hypothetical protein ACSNOH_22650 [Streptomyces sp. URMC 127]|uniref:hypothetical protein n=1 Tax=Streptomyces sp. URMC 127 TaxID=3423402 RepID=UPI003F1B101A
MKRLRSALTTAGVTVLLSVCGAVLASPAHAEVDLNALGGLAVGHANQYVGLDVADVHVINLPVSLAPVL